MKKITPKNTIDDYLSNSELNSRIYQVLLFLQDDESNGRNLLIRHPLEIFNQAYDICENLFSYYHPEELTPYIWNRITQTYSPHETSVIFSCVYIILYFTEKENPNMRFCLDRIKRRIDPAYFQEFEPLLNEELTYLAGLPVSFEFVKKEADQIQDLSKRELYYTECLVRHKQAKNKGNIIMQITDEIEFIQRTMQLSRIEKPTTEAADKDSGNVASIKVRAAIMLESLKKIGMTTAQNDLTKICKLIAYVLGCSYNTIYKVIQEGISFTTFHSREIDEANKILKNLSSSISIDIDKQY